MKLLDDRILQDGRSLPGGILKVDSFLNHQLDPNLMYEVAREFSRRFDNVSYNKIVTIEASGIAPATMLGYIRQLPVVFIKKKQPSTMDGMLISEVHSFTKDRTYTVCISRNFLTPPPVRRLHRRHGIHHRERLSGRRRPSPADGLQRPKPRHRRQPRRMPHHSQGTII